MLEKAPTGITGLDEIACGGLPRGRITLVAGGAGTGKTVLGMQTVVNGASRYDEPGAFISFEETPEELEVDFSSFGFGLEELVQQYKLVIDYIPVEPGQYQEVGEYDLEGLLLRVGTLIDKVKARRIVLDGLPALFYGFSDPSVVRKSLVKLLKFLKDRDLTAIITAEQESQLVKHGFSRTLSDCILLLSEATLERISTRYIRVAKYRGSAHSSDQFPFLIGSGGVSVLPLTSVELDYQVSDRKISTGIEDLDSMLGSGYFEGSSILVSGEAGTGKSSLAASLAESACLSGKKCIYFSLEESKNQITRNMESAGIRLKPFIEKGLLKLVSTRPSRFGLETQLVNIEQEINGFEPSVVIVDPVSSLESTGAFYQVKSMVARLIDFLRSKNITSMFTSLAARNSSPETLVGVSSLMDTWIELTNHESKGEQTRLLRIVKSRGMGHSNKVREFIISSSGLHLVDVCFGPGGILTGSARIMEQTRQKMESDFKHRGIEYKRVLTQNRQKALKARIESLNSEIEAEERALEHEKQELDIEDRLKHGPSSGAPEEGSYD